MKNKIIPMLSEILKVTIYDDCSAESVSEWDSLAHMRIVIALEEMFNIEVEDQDLPSLNSLPEILNYLERENIA